MCFGANSGFGARIPANGILASQHVGLWDSSAKEYDTYRGTKLLVCEVTASASFHIPHPEECVVLYEADGRVRGVCAFSN